MLIIKVYFPVDQSELIELHQKSLNFLNFPKGVKLREYTCTNEKNVGMDAKYRISIFQG